MRLRAVARAMERSENLRILSLKGIPRIILGEDIRTYSLTTGLSSKAVGFLNGNPFCRHNYDKPKPLLLITNQKYYSVLHS